MGFFAIGGFIMSLAGAGLGFFGARKANKRQQELLDSQMEDLSEVYELSEEKYDTAVEQTNEMAQKAEADVTEQATTVMHDMRQDRDRILKGTIDSTDIAGRSIFTQAVGNEGKTGEEFAQAGFSGVAMGGSMQQVTQQSAGLRDYNIETSTAQLDLQRDQGYYGAYGKERGAVNTNAAMNRELESIDLQLQNNLENLKQSKDLLDLNYTNQMDAMKDQKQWLQDNAWVAGAELAVNIGSLAMDFGSQVYEYELFGVTK